MVRFVHCDCACDTQDHFCIDGVCLVPPGSDAVCPSGDDAAESQAATRKNAAPSSREAWGALRKLVDTHGAEAVLGRHDH
jgi:hypothetical protein